VITLEKITDELRDPTKLFPLGRWLWEPGRVVLGAAVAVVTPFVIAILWPGSVPALKYFSVLLQFGGVGFLVWDAWERLQMSKASFWSWGKDWWSRFPFRRKIVFGVGHATLSLEASAAVEVDIALAPQLSTGDRLAQLERSFKLLNEQLKAQSKSFNDELGKIKSALKSEKQQSEQFRGEVTKDVGEVKTYTIGDVRLDIIGIVWVIVGVLLGGFPDEDIQCFSQTVGAPGWTCEIKTP
jgi:hypothetical protein